MSNRLVNLLLVFGSFLFCLVVFEVGLRVAGYDPFGDLITGQKLFLRESENPFIRYELNPDSEGFAWNTAIKINSHGFRDHEYSRVKPDGIYRIAVIGDSITFGNELSLEETYSKRLEQHFQGRGTPVEVLNFGVGGYDTVQEIALLEELALQFDIDEVIVGYCMNDLGISSANLAEIRRAEKYRSPIFFFRTSQFAEIYRNRLRLMYQFLKKDPAEKPVYVDIESFEHDPYVRDRVEMIKEYTAINPVRNRYIYWYADSRRVKKVAAAFERLNDLAQVNNFAVTVLIIPFVGDPVLPSEWAYDIVRHEATKQDFGVVEVVDRFLEVGGTAVQQSPNDKIHPNALGHSIIGESLYDFYVGEKAQRVLRPAADEI